MTEQVDLDALEALAKAATPGPWVMTAQGGIEPHDYAGPGEDANSVAQVRHDRNWEYIAAADPQAVLALIAELRQERERVSVWKSRRNEALDEEARLRTELEQERERYDLATSGWRKTNRELISAQDDLARAREAIDNTSHIHGPRKVWESDRAYTLVCTVCITEQYPCATVRTLAAYKQNGADDDE